MAYVVRFKLHAEQNFSDVMVGNEDTLLSLCYTLQWAPPVECFLILDTIEVDPGVESLKRFNWESDMFDKFRPWSTK